MKRVLVGLALLGVACGGAEGATDSTWGGWTEAGLSFESDPAYVSCRKAVDVNCMPVPESSRRTNCVRTAYAASDSFRPGFGECDATFGDCGDWNDCYLKVLVTQGQGEGLEGLDPWTGQR